MRCFVALGVVVWILSGSPAMAAEPDHVWSKQFGSADLDEPTSVAVDDLGNVIVVGRVLDPVDFGGGVLGPMSFIARYTPMGQHIWSKSFAGTNKIYFVAVNAAGTILVTGVYYGNLDLGGGALPSANGADAFLARFDADGNHLWSAAYGEEGDQAGLGAEFDGDGNMLITGFTNSGSIDFGGGSLETVESDAWIAKLEPDGDHVFSRRLGDVSTDPDVVTIQQSTEVVADPWNNVYVVGTFLGTVDFGDGPVTAGFSDLFLIKYDPTGAHVLTQTFTTGFGSINGNGVKTDLAGNVVIGGSYFTQTADVDFGGGPLPRGNEHAFLASFDPTGTHRWSLALGDTVSSGSTGLGIGLSPAGEVSLTGRFVGSVTIEDDTLQTGDYATGSFIARFGANGEYEWSKAFSLPSDFSETLGISTAIDNSGGVLMAGTFQGAGTIDFGGGPFESEGFIDGFLAKFKDPVPLPVLITRFEAKATDAGVVLQWDLWSDEALRGFTVYRSANGGTPAIVGEIGDVDARSFTDGSVEAGRRYRYELVVHGEGGEFRSPAAFVTTRAQELEIGQNRPNPFNPTTVIPYVVPGAELVQTSVRVFDVAGRLVRTLVDERKAGGKYTVSWDGRDDGANLVSSGVYFCVLEADRRRVMRKMVMLK